MLFILIFHILIQKITITHFNDVWWFLRKFPPTDISLWTNGNRFKDKTRSKINLQRFSNSFTLVICILSFVHCNHLIFHSVHVLGDLILFVPSIGFFNVIHKDNNQGNLRSQIQQNNVLIGWILIIPNKRNCFNTDTNYLDGQDNFERYKLQFGDELVMS